VKYWLSWFVIVTVVITGAFGCSGPEKSKQKSYRTEKRKRHKRRAHKRRVAKPPRHAKHPHQHDHPHGTSDHHHHPHPHPHLEGPDGHHHPY